MARLKSNILDGGTGRIGNIILYEWRGIPCMRSRPNQYKDKKSEAQLKQRQKMKVVHSFLGHFSNLFNLTFNEGNLGRTPYQAAVSYNLKYGVTGDYPNQTIDLRSALIAKGSLPLPESIELQVNENEVKVVWDISYFQNTKIMDDELYIFTLDKQGQGNGCMFKTKVKRKEGSCVMDHELYSGDDEVNIWAVFVNKNQSEVSNSVCLTC